MIVPQRLYPGDKVAIVSLSSGLLGESKCLHQLELGIKRLKDMDLIPVFMRYSLSGIDYLYHHPEARAEDLKQAFYDDEIKGIICAIGGDDTYRLLPFLLEDQRFVDHVKQSPKIFMGFSDTTNNHLMFYKLGLVTYYGPTFLTDFAELDLNMLPYTQKQCHNLFLPKAKLDITPSEVCYVDRKDYSTKALGTPRMMIPDQRGYDVIYGRGIIEGTLLGGCLESIYDAYTGSRYSDQKIIYDKYDLLPKISDWKDKIMFIETSEEEPTPDKFYTHIKELENLGILQVIKGMIIGKPHDEIYIEEYRNILREFAEKHQLPMLYNLNFGHAYPRTIIPYGIHAQIDFDQKKFTLCEPMII